ncbi:MAG: ATP-binding protein [Tenuifilaceae bacterium]|jgi:two-component system NtrC family sensor kinase|nr:ATP-binding protein [Tenuifilaceae bacterium]
MKRVQLPLFWKFSIAIAATVLLFGSLNLLFIRNQVYRTFENQIEKHGISIAKGIAERAVEPILYDDLSTLSKLVAQTKSVNTDVRYIFITNHNHQIIAHTFLEHIPRNILDVNTIPLGEDISVQVLKDPKDKNCVVRDIAIPILGHQIGVVRVGMCEREFQNEIRGIAKLFLSMVMIFLLLGIVAAFLLSYIITSPVKAISTYASQVDFETFTHDKTSSIPLNRKLSVRLKNLFDLTDEIDLLGTTFNEMIARLQSAYRELKSTQESLSQTEKMASVGTLTAGLAHEINNPLAGIRNCIRRIEDKPDNLKQNKEYIAMMSDALQKIERVVEGMLNFSRKQELAFTTVEINRLVNNTISLVKYQLEKSRIDLQLVGFEDAITLNASPNHLEQVFLNIMLNSIDAICEKNENDRNLMGKIIVRISENTNTVTIEFTDNGIGVPHDKVAAIFDPFFTNKKIKQGTGLGLAVSYNIISSHNGHITGWNVPTGGFTIAITLPKTE